jgi:hypothetical protein
MVAVSIGDSLISVSAIYIYHQKFPTNQSFTRPTAVFIEPFFCATLNPLKRAKRASSNKPELVVVVESTLSDADMRALFHEEAKPRLAAFSEVGHYNQTV